MCFLYMALWVESQEKNALRGANAGTPEVHLSKKTFSYRIVLVIVSPFYAVAAHAARTAVPLSRFARAPREFFAAACALALLLAMLSGCGRSHQPSARVPRPPRPAKIGATETGVASWYGHPYHGRATASGEIYDMEKFTAAHRTLPFETWLDVTNLANGKHVEVRITDRGPFVDGRIIDLSHAAAQKIDMLRAGTVRVRLKVIAPPAQEPSPDPPLVSAEVPPPPAVESPAAPPAIPVPPAVESPATPPPVIPFPPAAPGTGHYAVQAGAFADLDRAEAACASLQQQLGPAIAARVTGPTGQPPLWRVIAGRGLSTGDAAALADQIRKISGAAFVVPDPDLP